MKVLVAGDWHSDLHETEVCKSLRRLGHEPLEFKWFHYFAFDANKPRSLVAIVKRFQNKFVWGPLIGQINRDFLAQVRQQKPDVIFVYRGTHLTAQTLQTVRDELPGCKLVGYNNDDPFSQAQPRYLWRHFMACIPVYDLMLAYRHTNIDELKKAGARRVELLRSWYVPDRNYPIELTKNERDEYECDVVFIGHLENDDRLEFLEAIAKDNHLLKIYGPGYDWDPVLSKSYLLASQVPVRLVWGGEYNKILNGAKIALCFLSKLNRDTYTRRCFEIPASGTLLLSEYTDDLANLYEEGEEIAFFRNKKDMLDKIKYYLADSAARDKLARNGRAKVVAAGHDIDSRIEGVLKLIKDF